MALETVYHRGSTTTHIHTMGAETVKAVGAGPVGWGLLRIGLGAIFFWAFADKLLGLGYATRPENAWLTGGSPTEGFLTFGTRGPFAGFFQSIAGHPLTDALFMAGLAGVGLALLLGVGVRVAGYSGAAMVVLMWLAALPPANHPILDEHVIYAVALVVMTFVEAGRTFGLGDWWSHQEIVKRFPWLQ